MLIYKSLGNIEVDYDKKEVRAGGRVIDFGRLIEYEFEHVITEWSESDPQDSDAREHATFRYETMRVDGTCEELPEMTPDAEKWAALLDDVGLRLWFHYYQGGELKTSSLDFSRKDAFEARRKLKPLIKYLRDFRAGDDFNMFVGENHLRIGKGMSLDLARLAHYVELPWFGKCSIQVAGSSNPVTHVRLMTERRMSEEEVLPILDYMKRTMPTKMLYDDHGYGVLPKPHEVQHFWAVPQGEVHMTWDGINRPNADGLDYVVIELWDIDLLNETRDEKYWRSEVD